MRICGLTLLVHFIWSSTLFAQPEKGFVNITDINKDINVEMRYASNWNFVGRPIIGYKSNKCFLTQAAATALSHVEKYIQASGYSLLVFDCYRPQRSVSEFMNWINNSDDQKMKKIFYIEEPKETLVSRGYIAQHSSHSSGSTVDITLIHNSNAVKSATRTLTFQEDPVDCRAQKNVEATGQVNMGTTFDCFSKLANTANPSILDAAKKNRQFLKHAMEKFGFVNYPKEWWHFNFKNEPFKNRYFDFVVE